MNLFFLHLLPNKPAAPVPVPVLESNHAITESAEFFNNTIRVADLPVMRTEESIAPGSPKNLW